MVEAEAETLKARAECERKFGLGLIDEYAAREEVWCDEPADGGGGCSQRFVV